MAAGAISIECSSSHVPAEDHALRHSPKDQYESTPNRDRRYRPDHGGHDVASQSTSWLDRSAGGRGACYLGIELGLAQKEEIG